jgi:hypothetical protein
VLEFQLKATLGTWLNDVITATTLAVALRDALAELIGVQANELGCDIKQAKPESGVRCYSILIFDRYAAGYASSAARYIASIFHMARKRLECAKHCDLPPITSIERWLWDSSRKNGYVVLTLDCTSKIGL